MPEPVPSSVSIVSIFVPPLNKIPEPIDISRLLSVYVPVGRYPCVPLAGTWSADIYNSVPMFGASMVITPEPFPPSCRLVTIFVPPTMFIPEPMAIGMWPTPELADILNKLLVLERTSSSQ